MLIQVHLKDTFGNPCSLDDVILMRHKSPQYYYLGLLTFSQSLYTFILSDAVDDYVHLTEPCLSWQRLCHISECPALEKELGRIVLQSKKANINKILQMAQQAVQHQFNYPLQN